MDEDTRSPQDALRPPHVRHLATSGPDQRPHVSAVRADLGGEHIPVNSALWRIKARNITRDPLVASSWCDAANSDHNFAIQGRVVETLSGEPAQSDCDVLAGKYPGLDRPQRGIG